MRAVVSVVGKDRVGILSGVSSACAEAHMNITDVTQSILQDMFVMIMMIESTEDSTPLAQFAAELSEMGKSKNLSIHVMHEDIFNAMHRI